MADPIDARDHTIAMREVTAGTMPTIPDSAVDDYLAAPTPLAFWRKHRGFTQAGLAKDLDVSQAYLAMPETGKREGSVMITKAPLGVESGPR
jgi:hypothetical protein